MSAAPWTVGRYVVETLAANGIDTVFGIPGVHNLELYRGLELARLRHVLGRHEQNAGFAADGYARATAHPAAAFVISGPGVSNALRALAADVTAYAGSARTPEQVRDQLRAAFAALRGHRPRPAYLDIPLDLLAESTLLRPQPLPVAPPPLAPDGGALLTAAGLLATAQRPLFIAGGGARAAGAALRTLLEATDGYLVTTVAGKGVVAESHPANLGATLPYRPTQERIAAADVVLAAGTELSETDLYTTTRLPIPGRLIRLDTDPVKLGDHYEADVAVRGDAAAGLQIL